MKPEKKTPQEVFYNPGRLVVPLFQRPYTWRKEEQWEPLWQDLLRLMEVRGGIKPSATHFFGAIVIQQVQTAPGELPTWTVIDGQQRLTTLQLLLDALHSQMVAHGWSDLAGSVELLVENPAAFLAMPGVPKEHRFKLWPTTKDRASFEAVMAAAIPVDYSLLPDCALTDAHRYFGGVIEGWLSAEPNPRGAATSLISAVTQGLELVSIALEINEDAQAIFETLNARGVPLSAADLIKNFVFQELPGAEVQKELVYDAHWAQFETPWWEREIQTGRVKHSRASLFLWHWLRARMLDDFPIRSLFPQFRLYVETSGVSVASLVPELRSAAEKYRSIIEGAASPTGALTRDQLFAYRVGVLDSEIVRPLLIWLDEPGQADISSSDRTRIIETLESWFIRRALVKAPSAGANRFMVDLLKHLARQPHDELARATVDFLKNNHTPVAYWPGDSEVRDALKEAQVYKNLVRARLRMVLEALEDDLRGYPDGARLAMGPVVRTKGTVEHIMPQKWQTNWSADLSSEEAAERDRRVHWLGNLTLLTQTLNTKVSNDAWVVKRAALAEVNSELLTNAALASAESGWTETVIAARTSSLIEQIVRVWPAPTGHVGKPGAAVTPTAAPAPSVDVAQLVEAGWIPVGATLRAKPASADGVVAAVAQDGRIFVGETAFGNPTAAIAHLVPYEVNGWVAWEVEGTGWTLAEFRAAYLDSIGEDGSGDTLDEQEAELGADMAEPLDGAGAFGTKA